MDEFPNRSEMGDVEMMTMKKAPANTSLPKLSLPPKAFSDNIFKNTSDGPSPSPMTFVSSLFAEDPYSEHKSFSQLLGSNLSPLGDDTKDSWFFDSTSHTGMYK